MKLSLRIRREPNDLATVWLIEVSGSGKGIKVSSGLLCGIMTMAKAEELALTLGICFAPEAATDAVYAENGPKEKLARQNNLFKEMDCG